MSRSQGSTGEDARLALERALAAHHHEAERLVAAKWPERALASSATALRQRRYYLLADQRSTPHV